jgi:hypothetical protein
MASGLRFVKRAVQADLARFKTYVEMKDAKGIDYRPNPDNEKDDENDDDDGDSDEPTSREQKSDEEREKERKEREKARKERRKSGTSS